MCDIGEEDSTKFECGFQEIYCDYRGKDGVCEIEEQDGPAVCPANE